MRRVSDPLNPRDPSSSASEKISAAADRARKQLREDFHRLRAEIGEPPAGDTGDRGQPSGPGRRSRAGAAVAALALTAAIATAATSFALNGGSSQKDAGALVPEHSPGGEAAGVGGAEARGSGSRPHLLSAAAGPGLGHGTIASS